MGGGVDLLTENITFYHTTLAFLVYILLVV